MTNGDPRFTLTYQLLFGLCGVFNPVHVLIKVILYENKTFKKRISWKLALSIIHITQVEGSVIDFLDSVQGKRCHQHHILWPHSEWRMIWIIYLIVLGLFHMCPCFTCFAVTEDFNLNFWEILIWATVWIRGFLSSNIPSGTPASSPAHQLISTIRAARWWSLSVLRIYLARGCSPSASS